MGGAEPPRPGRFLAEDMPGGSAGPADFPSDWDLRCMNCVTGPLPNCVMISMHQSFAVAGGNGRGNETPDIRPSDGRGSPDLDRADRAQCTPYVASPRISRPFLGLRGANRPIKGYK